jgi:hypothetical protein
MLQKKTRYMLAAEVQASEISIWRRPQNLGVYGAEWQVNSKDLEAKGYNLIEMPFRHLPGRPGENHEKSLARIRGVRTETRSEYLPNASLERCHCNYLLSLWNVKK